MSDANGKRGLIELLCVWNGIRFPRSPMLDSSASQLALGIGMGNRFSVFRGGLSRHPE